MKSRMGTYLRLVAKTHKNIFYSNAVHYTIGTMRLLGTGTEYQQI
jgi:hypothetical protein